MKTDITCMLAATFCMQDVSWETDSFSVYFGCSKEGGLISVVMVSGIDRNAYLPAGSIKPKYSRAKNLNIGRL